MFDRQRSRFWVRYIYILENLCLFRFIYLFLLGLLNFDLIHFFPHLSFSNNCVDIFCICNGVSLVMLWGLLSFNRVCQTSLKRFLFNQFEKRDLSRIERWKMRYGFLELKSYWMIDWLGLSSVNACRKHAWLTILKRVQGKRIWHRESWIKHLDRGGDRRLVKFRLYRHFKNRYTSIFYNLLST